MCNADFDILEKTVYLEVPPRVGYKFTQFGLRFASILNTVRELQSDVDRQKLE